MAYPNFYPGATYIGSPFYSSRGNTGPEAFVLHVMDGTLAGADSWFNSPQNLGQVSAHFGMDKLGELHQYVLLNTAAHANGVIENWNLKLIKDNNYTNPNTWTVSLEMEGFGPFNDCWPEQFEKAATLCAWVFKEVLFKSGATGVAIDRDHILQHSDITPLSRPNCAGWSEQRMALFINRVKQIYGGQLLDPRVRQARDLLSQVLT